MIATNRGGIVNRNQEFFAISPNYMDLVPQGYYLQSNPKTPKTSLTQSQLLYTRFANSGSLISENLRDNVGIQCGGERDSYLIKQTYSQRSFKLQATECTAAMSRMPGFVMSDRPGTTRGQVVLSYIQYFYLLEGISLPFKDTVTYSRILMKSKPDANVDSLMASLKILTDKYNFRTYYYKEFASRFKSNTDIMNLVSVALTIIVLSLSLFSLVSTMAANIVE